MNAATSLTKGFGKGNTMKSRREDSHDKPPCGEHVPCDGAPRQAAARGGGEGRRDGGREKSTFWQESKGRGHGSNRANRWAASCAVLCSTPPPPCPGHAPDRLHGCLMHHGVARPVSLPSPCCAYFLRTRFLLVMFLLMLVSGRLDGVSKFTAVFFQPTVGSPSLDG